MINKDDVVIIFNMDTVFRLHNTCRPPCSFTKTKTVNKDLFLDIFTHDTNHSDLLTGVDFNSSQRVKINLYFALLRQAIQHVGVLTARTYLKSYLHGGALQRRKPDKRDDFLYAPLRCNFQFPGVGSW